MLTRQHFELIAKVLRRIEKLDERLEIAEKTAKGCKRDNPRFDRQKFLKACGLKT